MDKGVSTMDAIGFKGAVVRGCGGGDAALFSCSCSLLDISLSSLTGCRLDTGTSILRNGDMLRDLPVTLGPDTVGEGGVKLRAGERDLLLVLLPFNFPKKNKMIN